MNAKEMAELLAEGLAEDGLAIHYERKGVRRGEAIAWTDQDMKDAIRAAFLNGWSACEDHHRREVSS